MSSGGTPALAAHDIDSTAEARTESTLLAWNSLLVVNITEWSYRCSVKQPQNQSHIHNLSKYFEYGSVHKTGETVLN